MGHISTQTKYLDIDIDQETADSASETQLETLLAEYQLIDTKLASYSQLSSFNYSQVAFREEEEKKLVDRQEEILREISLVQLYSLRELKLVLKSLVSGYNQKQS